MDGILKMTECEYCGHLDSDPVYPMPGTIKYQACGCDCHILSTDISREQGDTMLYRAHPELKPDKKEEKST